MTARFAQLIDALHCESRQILHHSLRNCVVLEPVHRVSITNSGLTDLSYKMFLNVGIVRLGPSGVNRNPPLGIVVAFHVENRFRLLACSVFQAGQILKVLVMRVQPRPDSRFDPRVPVLSLAWQEYAFSFAILQKPLSASSGGQSPVA